MNNKVSIMLMELGVMPNPSLKPTANGKAPLSSNVRPHRGALRSLVTQLEGRILQMNHYLISFPSSAMSHISNDDFASVGESSRAVIREAKAAGVYVFGGGINESVAPVIVTGEGKVSSGTYPGTGKLNGGFCVLKARTREEAEAWAAKTAAGCWCSQELRNFMHDPES